MIASSPGVDASARREADDGESIRRDVFALDAIAGTIACWRDGVARGAGLLVHRGFATGSHSKGVPGMIHFGAAMPQGLVGDHPGQRDAHRLSLPGATRIVPVKFRVWMSFTRQLR